MKTKRTIPAGQVRNRIVIFLHGIGLPVGPTYLLTVPGRTSGLPRTTPVAPVVIDGTIYILQAYPNPEWVKNVQAAGYGVLTRGRRKQTVDLLEVPEEQRSPILREFPSQVPMGVTTFLRNGLADSRSAAGFAAAAPRCRIFRATPRPDPIRDEQPPSAHRAWQRRAGTGGWRVRDSRGSRTQLPAGGPDSSHKGQP